MEPAAVFCKDCINHYCRQCSSIRHQHPKRRGHILEELVEEQLQHGGNCTLNVYNYIGKRFGTLSYISATHVTLNESDASESIT